MVFYSFIDSSEDYIRRKTFEGFSALHFAAHRGHWKIVQILLEAGADPNATTLEETTPLFLGEICHLWYRFKFLFHFFFFFFC